MSLPYLLYCLSTIFVLKNVNEIVPEPYMDEPFHVPQAQAYCRGEFDVWDPKITTPPGLYIMSLALKYAFVLKCNISMLRMTVAVTLLGLPLVLTRLLCFHQRIRARNSFFSPSTEGVVLASFPIAWFFGFLYYTEVPSLLLVILTFVAATNDHHWLASILGLLSCTFRQNNIIWALYAFAASMLMEWRFKRPADGAKLYDPMALEATLGDIFRIVKSAPSVLMDLVKSFVPYTLLIGAFAAFIAWNGGIVLGDKSNHVPVLHVPQMYYFIGFATAFGWPALISGNTSIVTLARDVCGRMAGSMKRACITLVISVAMAFTIWKFTIHHPFVLSDNRHYVFYVWRRIFMLHPIVPYMLIPAYIACAWAWFLRVGHDQTLLQTALLPCFTLLALLPTPLLEPRYFLIPYIFLRAQLVDLRWWGLLLEAAWYTLINAGTMGVFLYLPREGVGRFMW
ncbi:glycosyltransferase family 59 protein [Cylindrobasidium torrendii FP15055 ss-10]|uniref:Dol-P-Glc:Glc(2)Man(9)GlcNAc(2)-PP-Dol alpha-1,2-glucosyltransferase n=1 Tax=Cylindrobasidium torrendii FP15055 ss-10 TaxID=1314674 RepID=A0A0D7B5Y5_9AGAR|nr:glycosyltransferase family 59 protein [Cylindrobasidium torrendii FP15055 ss-10]